MERRIPLYSDKTRTVMRHAITVRVFCVTVIYNSLNSLHLTVRPGDISPTKHTEKEAQIEADHLIRVRRTDLRADQEPDQVRDHVG